MIQTQEEIEAALCEGIAHFQQSHMGLRPREIQAHLLGDLLVVRLQGVLSAAEQKAAQTIPAKRGRDLLKHLQADLIEAAGR